MLREEQHSRRRRTAALLVCIGLGVSLGVWANRAARSGRSDPISSLARAVTAPFVGGLANINRWAGRQVGWLTQGRTLAIENSRLRVENERLREDNARLAEADISLRRLREQMGFQQADPTHRIPADVISLRPTSGMQTLVIARGARHGVKPQAVVVTPGGLVGRVSQVGATTSTVMLLVDANSAVGAMVQRASSRAVGVCRGSGGATLTMAYLVRGADVRKGDTIVSSGLGGEKGVFPKGLIIGHVTAVANDASGSSRVVTVQPAADFARLEEVFVLQ